MENLLEILISLDERIFLFFNGMHNEFWNHFMPLFTSKFTWIPMYLTILFILYRKYSWKVATIYMLALGLTILLADQICATYIRPYVERLRPSNLENEISSLTYIVNGYRGGRYGFPSCHAANSFALATFMNLITRHRRFIWFIFIWALINSYTRLYLGVHYPGDLLIGGTIGAMIGFGIYHAVSYIISHMDSNEIPHRQFNVQIVGQSLILRDTDTMLFAGIFTTIIILSISAIRTIAG